MLYRTFCNKDIWLYFYLFYWSLRTPQFYEIGKIVESFKIEFVSNALFTDNVNPITFKMTGEFRCVSFLVNNCIQYFPCAFDVPFCIR